MARYGTADVSTGSLEAAPPADLAPGRAQLALLLADMQADVARPHDAEAADVTRSAGPRRPRRRSAPLPLDEALLGYLEGGAES